MCFRCQRNVGIDGELLQRNGLLDIDSSNYNTSPRQRKNKLLRRGLWPCAARSQATARRTWGRSPNDYADHLVGLLTQAYDEARAQLGRSTQRAKRYYDYKSWPQSFEAGDLVRVYSPHRYKGRTPKWQRCYSGPYEVVRRVNAVNYVVRKNSCAQPLTIHVNKFNKKLCCHEEATWSFVSV